MALVDNHELRRFANGSFALVYESSLQKNLPEVGFALANAGKEIFGIGAKFGRIGPRKSDHGVGKAEVRQCLQVIFAKLVAANCATAFTGFVLAHEGDRVRANCKRSGSARNRLFVNDIHSLRWKSGTIANWLGAVKVTDTTKFDPPLFIADLDDNLTLPLPK